MIKPEKNIRVLLVDDSRMVRDMIRTILESEPGIVVVGEASNGAEAITKVVSLKPDIVTMDIEMPVMGGLEAIEKIIAVHPVPILVVTALTGVRTAFAAVSKGALDVIEKPDIDPENVRNLVQKIRILARVNVSTHLLVMRGQQGIAGASRVTIPNGCSKGGIVAIAASTGGPQASNAILSHLPANFPVPIVIAQHMAEGFTKGMVAWLNTGTPLMVREAEGGDHLAAGCVYINPAEHSMVITGKGMVVLGVGDARQVYHPSCNTLLSSVASAYQEAAIGLILSGMGDDGVSGMEAIRKAGGVTMAQDATSSVIFGMNRLAVERGCIDRVLPLAEIPGGLIQLAGAR
ncbi:MAG: chemotaxis-specific protein-glutamate methyltransferase CheB [Desulfuromonadaceae bacterium]|nr:chemotaxis-specific protein-glutamate methyltransferase CheB [Desulfuromonadaceae bacterium]